MLARAVAGEAGVAFASTSGASIASQTFAGSSATLIRTLFRNATERAPVIIYIDEIDSLGKKRSEGSGSGISEDRDAALNTLLAELDGFRVRNSSTQVIVLASTNRPESLDPALLRPGRFDRKVFVGLPDVKGRADILRVHSEGKRPLAPDVDLMAIACKTTGFSGADLENLLNEAAIFAARSRLNLISAANIDDAWEKVILGLSSRKRPGANARAVVSAHEAGHALAGLAMEAWMDPPPAPFSSGLNNGALRRNLNIKRVSKVSILPRLGLGSGGAAGGFTVFDPDEALVDDGLSSRQYLLADLLVTLAGRAAEELVLGSDFVTTGASADFRQARLTVKSLVGEYGMSAAGLGPHTQETLKAEEERLILVAYGGAKRILRANRASLDALSKALVDFEALDRESIDGILARVAPAGLLDVGAITELINLPLATLRSEQPYHRDFNATKD